MLPWPYSETWRGIGVSELCGWRDDLGFLGLGCAGLGFVVRIIHHDVENGT